MAAVDVLERREKRTFMDDTIPLTATITTYKLLPSHVEYIIRVQRGPNPDDSWEVAHRYSDFDALHQSLLISKIPLTLPPKKTFGSTDRQFLVERQQGLQAYLDAILREPPLASTVEMKRFLDPHNYSVNFYGSLLSTILRSEPENRIALRNVSMFFRSNPNWSVVDPLRNIGWRFRKQYYLIVSKTDPKQPKHLLSWCEPGPDFSLGERELEASMKLLTEIKHPHILSPVYASYNSSGMMVVRRYVPSGSLRDLIYGVKPNNHILQKYASPAKRQFLSIADIRKYGRQVLEALHFLLEKGFVLGHVHAGNVIIEDGSCKLVDIENTLVGLPSMYRTHLLELRKIHTNVGETVYSFGHMLYEMSLGHQLKSAMMDPRPPNTPESIAKVLELILSPQGIKNGLPSIADLLANSFFTEVNGLTGEKPSLRVPSKLKEVIKGHIEQAEQRLREQQRKVSQFRRLTKAHENLMSEEEKKKRRKKMKKQMSMQETSESASYPTTTSLPRQQTVGQITAHPPKSISSTKMNGTTSTTKKSSSTTPAPKAPPPPAGAAPPSPRPTPPPSRSSDRGALLGSIEGFKKGKLKKTVTNDRSGPLIRR